MHPRSIFILFLFFIATNSKAQILEINKPLFSEEPFFNTAFIQRNKIASITGSRSSKKVSDIIRQKGLDYQYLFNPNGTLKTQLSTFYVQKDKKDTNIISYQYNKQRTLTLKRKSDRSGFYSLNYQLDQKGNIVKQTYCRDENTYNSKNQFKLAKQYIIRADSFSYHQLNEQQLKKIFYNNYGKSYKEQISYYNDYGYLIAENTKFIIGNKKSKRTFEYDEKGRVSKTVDINKNQVISKIYSYDEIGNILEIKIYDKDQFVTSHQYLYDEKTMLLTAQLIKDVETEFIQIVKYRYTFH